MIPHINVINFLKWVRDNFTLSVKDRGWIKNNTNDLYTEKLVYKDYLNNLDNK
jgi:hypothetical protein